MDTANTEQTATRAYSLWQEAGCPEGEAERFWFKAEQELNGGTDGHTPDHAADNPDGAPMAVAAKKPRAKRHA